MDTFVYVPVRCYRAEWWLIARTIVVIGRIVVVIVVDVVSFDVDASDASEEFVSAPSGVSWPDPFTGGHLSATAFSSGVQRLHITRHSSRILGILLQKLGLGQPGLAPHCAFLSSQRSLQSAPYQPSAHLQRHVFLSSVAQL